MSSNFRVYRDQNTKKVYVHPGGRQPPFEIDRYPHVQANGKRLEFWNPNQPELFPIARLSFEYVTADDTFDKFTRVVRVIRAESQSEECPTEPPIGTVVPKPAHL